MGGKPATSFPSLIICFPNLGVKLPSKKHRNKKQPSQTSRFIFPPRAAEPSFPSSLPATYSSVYLLCSPHLLLHPPTAHPSLPPQHRVLSMAKPSTGQGVRTSPKPLQGWPGKALALVRWVSRFLAANAEKREFHSKMSAFWSSSADIKCALTLAGPIDLSTPFCSGTFVSPQRHERVPGLSAATVSHRGKLTDTL